MNRWRRERDEAAAELLRLHRERGHTGADGDELAAAIRDFGATFYWFEIQLGARILIVEPNPALVAVAVWFPRRDLTQIVAVNRIGEVA